MASLLDYDFDLDLDKMLGTTVNPVEGLVNDPNFQTEKNIASGIGVADALIGGYGKQYAPEILLRGLINAKKGRQGVIDKQVKSYMTQQDMLTQTLKNRKLNQDIRLNEYGIADAPLKSKKLGYETSEAKNKSILSDTQIDGIKRLIKTLPEHEQYELATVGPKAFYNNRPITQQDRIFYESIGVPNRFQIPEDKVNIIREYNLTMPQEAADRHNVLEQAKQAADPSNYNPNYVTGKLEFAKSLINNNKLNKNNNRNFTEEYNNKNNYSQNEKFVGFKQVDGKDIYHGMGGERYTRDEFNNLGRREILMHNPAMNKDQYLKKYNEISNDKVSDQKILRFGIAANKDLQRNIEKIMSKPETLKKLFTTGGRFRVKFNEMTAGWFAEFGGDAQDVKNFIETLKAKQFTAGITAMRNANKTGGAVGNVSDKEVAMFQNMEQFLDITGSGGNMYVALKDLYQKSKEVSDYYNGVYIADYGQAEFEKSNLPSAAHLYKTFGSDGDYADTLEEALIRGGFNPETGELLEDNNSTEVEQDIQSLINQGAEWLKGNR